MPAARPCTQASRKPRASDVTDKDVREYVMKVPAIYAEAVAEGRGDEVAWMQRTGILGAAARMRENTERRQAAFEAQHRLHL